MWNRQTVPLMAVHTLLISHLSSAAGLEGSDVQLSWSMSPILKHRQHFIENRLNNNSFYNRPLHAPGPLGMSPNTSLHRSAWGIRHTCSILKEWRETLGMRVKDGGKKSVIEILLYLKNKLNNRILPLFYGYLAYYSKQKHFQSQDNTFECRNSFL